MATDKEFAQYVQDQLGHSGSFSLRPMFGEYGAYLDGKVLGFVCDNTFFLKVTAAGQALLGEDAPTGPCYPGSKPYFILDDLENPERMLRLLRATWDALPEPKQKKARKNPSKNEGPQSLA